jgi:hypothetical protein
MLNRPDNGAVLSLRQEARLRTNGLDEGHQVVCAAFIVNGVLDIAHLRSALLRVASRNDVLRMRLSSAHNDEFVPSFPPVSDIPVKEDAVPMPESGVTALVTELSTAEHRTPFDLRSGPLLRARVTRLGEDRHLLLIITEHLIADGMSVQLLCDELGAAYDALRSGESWDPPLSRQFPEYARWQREILSGPERDELVSYWRDHLDGSIPRLHIGDNDNTEAPVELGVMRPTPTHLLEGHYNASDLPTDLGVRLGEFCREERVTNFIVGATAMFVMLCKATRDPHAVILSPFAARPPDFTDVIGDFSTPLPLRAEVNSESTALTLLRVVRATVLDAIEHEQLPYPELNRARKHHALPDNRIAYFAANEPISLRLADAEVSTIESPVTNTLFDLSCWLTSDGDELSVATLHRSTWFSSAAARRWHDSYGRLLAEITSEPDRTLESLTATLDLDDPVRSP